MHNNKSKRFSKYGLIVVSALKNFIIFFLMGGLLGIDVYKEGLEIYRDIMNVIPWLKNIVTPEIGFALLWIFMFVCESYVIRSYFDIIIGKLSKRNKC